MGNKRKEIREALKTLIEADVQFDDVNVYTSRRSPVVQTEELPSLTIVTPNESATRQALNCKGYIRKLELRIEVRVDSDDDADDKLDDLLSLVEDFISTNETVSGEFLIGLTLVNTETDIGIEANKEIGLGTLIFEGTYIA